MDFSSPGTDTFSEKDCDIFGQSGVEIGIRLCVAKYGLVMGGLKAGTDSLVACIWRGDDVLTRRASSLCLQ